VEYQASKKKMTADAYKKKLLNGSK